MRTNQLLAELRKVKLLGAFREHFAQENAASSGGIKASSTYVVQRLPELRQKVNMAAPLPVIGSLVLEMNDSAVLQTLYPRIVLDIKTFLELSSLAQRIDAYVDAIIGVIVASGGDNIEENEVSIRLPLATQIASVADSLSRLDRVLNQAMSVLEESPKISVKRWENGSLWVDILVGSISGVVLIGGLAWAAACAFKKYQEGRVLEKLTESLGMKNQVLGVIRDGVDKAVNVVIDAEARRLDEKHSKGKGDPETIKRLQFCISELYDMMRAGTEVHPSLLAPEEVKNLFPNMEEVLSLPSTQKMLKEHSDADSGQEVASE